MIHIIPILVLATVICVPAYATGDNMLYNGGRTNTLLSSQYMVNGRKVERVVRVYGKEYGYTNTVQEMYIVQYPVTPKEGRKCPLYVVLHSAGHDADKAILCTQTPDDHDIYRAPDDFYALYMDCRMAKDSDWWWGANKYQGFNLSPCEKRIIATIEEIVVKYSIDRDRIYLCGNSMGGSGTLGIGLRHGDLFAAIKANVPALVKHACGRMGWDMNKKTNVAGIDFTSIPDPPFLVDYSAPNDKWSDGHEHLVAMMSTRKYPWQLLWGAFGHADNDSQMLPKNDIIHAFAWTKVRKSDILPVFTNASCDSLLPWPACRSSINPGQINAFFRWADGLSTDVSVSIRIFLADVMSHHFIVPDRATADVTLRRLGTFKVKCGDSLSWTYNGKSGTVVVGKDGLLTIPMLEMVKASRTLVIKKR